ncbi:MAG: hypothetical protein D6723_13490 [Acidobacteria bacterium]|nr:MAG: hypothetical protein D6723_13490 [Acidobacteriota bacterium]
MKCTNPHIGRLITRYEFGALDESERAIFLDHLIECVYCHNEVYAMRPFMEVLREHRREARRRMVHEEASAPSPLAQSPPSPWFRRSLLVAASVLVVICLSLVAVYLMRLRSAPEMVTQPRDVRPESEIARTSPWSEMVIPKAPYQPPEQPGRLRGEGRGSPFQRAMAAYRQNDFAAAAQQLEAVTRLNPSHAPAYFYWGVSLLLADRSREAIFPLKRAIRLGNGTLREQSHYYLALAYLKTDRPRRALQELDEVVALDGTYRGAAERLRERVRQWLNRD